MYIDVRYFFRGKAPEIIGNRPDDQNIVDAKNTNALMFLRQRD